MYVNPEIFKAYDIRGIYPDDLNEAIAYSLGRAFITLLKVSEVIVGRDMRIASPVLFKGFTNGILEQGADVIDIGMISTDQFYFACSKFNLPGVMVTASHNPKQYGGLKMVRKLPYLLSGDEGIQDLRRIIENEDYASNTRVGSMRYIDLSEEFIAKVLSFIDVSDLVRKKVVVDTCNGMVGPILQRIYARLPIELIGIYLEPDGTFPNHGPDPMQAENRRDLQRRVVLERADVGFAFDGDGDRVFVIDDQGEYISGDFLTVLLARHLLKKEPGSKIIYDMGSSWAVPDYVKDAGGVPLIERVGHTFIKRRLADEQALFAGDRAGHNYFRDFGGADSGVIASLLVLELLSEAGKSLVDLLEPLRSTYFTSGEINSVVDDIGTILDELAARYTDGDIERLDGITVSYPTWHFNVRPSNTEPLLRLSLEARSREEMEQKRDEVLGIIRGAQHKR